MTTLPLDDFLRLYAQSVQLRAMRFPRRVYLGEHLAGAALSGDGGTAYEEA